MMDFCLQAERMQLDASLTRVHAQEGQEAHTQHSQAANIID